MIWVCHAVYHAYRAGFRFGVKSHLPPGTEFVAQHSDNAARTVRRAHHTRVNLCSIICGAGFGFPVGFGFPTHVLDVLSRVLISSAGFGFPVQELDFPPYTFWVSCAGVGFPVQDFVFCAGAGYPTRVVFRFAVHDWGSRSWICRQGFGLRDLDLPCWILFSPCTILISRV